MPWTGSPWRRPGSSSGRTRAYFQENPPPHHGHPGKRRPPLWRSWASGSVPPQANFLLSPIRAGEGGAPGHPAGTRASLWSAGGGKPTVEDYLRITIGTEGEMEQLIRSCVRHSAVTKHRNKENPLRYEGKYLPSPEWRSYLLQVTVGCSHNRSVPFTCMYRDKAVPHPPHGRYLWGHQDGGPTYNRMGRPVKSKVFLCDGDAVIMQTEQLLAILKKLYDTFPGWSGSPPTPVPARP